MEGGGLGPNLFEGTDFISNPLGFKSNGFWFFALRKKILELWRFGKR